VKVLASFPPDSHLPIVYPAALTAAAKGDAPARFLRFLQSPAARPIFEAAGFMILEGARSGS
jgi:molybdate transport system substrate-binding protein